jgi:hypothetical protein
MYKALLQQEFSVDIEKMEDENTKEDFFKMVYSLGSNSNQR